MNKCVRFTVELIAKITAFQHLDGRATFSDAAKRLIELGLASLDKKEVK